MSDEAQLMKDKVETSWPIHAQPICHPTEADLLPGLPQAGDLVASTGSDDAKAKAVKVSIQYYVSITHAGLLPLYSHAAMVAAAF